MYNILVVEDDLLLQKVVSLTLRQKGFSVEVSPTAKDALENLEVNDYDLILMDVGLPDMSGMDLTKRIRKQYGEKLLVSALTAHDEEKVLQACIDAGMNYAMSKPLDDKKIKKLEELLKSRD